MPTGLFIIGLIFAFVYGTAIGSFLNVCIYRLPREESLVTPPSHCPQCNTRLRPADLVPLLSYLLLKGKCRYCGVRISPRYFTIELITGLLFLAGWYALALRVPDLLWTPTGLLLLVAAWAFTASMLVTFVIDLDTTYVFEPVTWVGMAAGLIFEITDKYAHGTVTSYLPDAVTGMVIGFIVFVAMDLFGCLLFRKASMGVGDALIGAAIGAMLGRNLALLSFAVAIVLGAVVGIVILTRDAIAAKRRKARGKQRPRDEADAPEAPVYFPIKMILLSIGLLAGLWWAESAVSAALVSRIGLNPSYYVVLALLFGAAVVGVIAFLSARWPQQLPDDVQPTMPTLSQEEPAEGQHYMPFGPFLTASAMLIALAPDWCATAAQRVIFWWLYLNPYLS